MAKIKAKTPLVISAGNPALEFIQVTQEFNISPKKKKKTITRSFVHYSHIQIRNDKEVYVVELGYIKETPKQIVEAIRNIGVKL